MSEVIERVNISYTLIFKSSFHFGTGLRNGLIDRTVARNQEEYLYVPGSTLKGVLRHRCEQIAKLFNLAANEPHSEENAHLEANLHDPDIIIRIFGSRFLPGQLYFDDALLSEDVRKAYFEYTPSQAKKGEKIITKRYKAEQVEERTQVSLSRRTRVAKQGHLFTSEYGIQQLHFRGKIYGHIKGLINKGMPCSYALWLLLAGLKSLDQIGGNKSAGFGQVECKLDNLIQLNGQDVNPDDLLTSLSDLELYAISRGDEK